MPKENKFIDINNYHIDDILYSWDFNYHIGGGNFNVLKEFKINKYISLKLGNEGSDKLYTRIFLNDQMFLQCAYILIQNPHKHESQSEIDSIDEAAEKLDSRLEKLSGDEPFMSPETIFWAIVPIFRRGAILITILGCCIPTCRFLC